MAPLTGDRLFDEKDDEEMEHRMSLSAVTRGTMKRPLKLVGYGPSGVGKSTFASQAPGVIFLCAEDGTGELDVARFPEPKSWTHVLSACQELLTGEHDFKTLAIDSLDWLAPLVKAHTIEQNKMTEEKFDAYGRGESFALRHWREFIQMLDLLRADRGMHIIALAHSICKTFKNPEGDDFDRYQLALSNQAAALWEQWSDTMLFLTWETATQKTSEHGRAKGLLGERVICTQRAAAYDAKNRFGLDSNIPFERDRSWKAFSDAVSAARKRNQATNSNKEEAA